MEATSFTLAHVSDPHLGPPGHCAAPSDTIRLTIKQRLTLRKWRYRRRHVFSADVAALTAADIAAARPDHIAVTGDLANAGLAAEFDAAAAWLATLAPGNASSGWNEARLSLVPGNHDALARGTWEMGAVRLGLATPGTPWCRRLGDIALVGLSTARPTAPLLATGTLGAGQLARAESLLAEAGAAGLCRVVLLHHPPGETTTARRALTDRRALARMLDRVGAELLLYGHNHRAEETRIGTVGIPALGAPSAAGAPGSGAEPAGWHAITLAGRPGAWQARVTLRRLGDDGRFAEAWQRDLAL